MFRLSGLFFSCSLLVFPSLVSSRGLARNEQCVSAILSLYGSLQFEGAGYGDYYGSACGNPAKVASMYAAASLYCTPDERASGFKLLNEYCAEYGPGALMPETEVAVNTSSTAVQRMEVIDSTDDAATTNFTNPVMVSERLYKLSYRTQEDWNHELRSHTNYGFAMYGFWGGVLLVGLVRRLSRTLQHRRSSSARDFESGRNSVSRNNLYTRASAWSRKHIITPSILPPYHIQPIFGFTIPTRLEFIVIFLYWIVSIVLCAVDYRGFEGNLFWARVPPQTWRYLADRTGIICYSNLPILWMFSGRNNIFIWLTGWEFSVFNLFHKHIARVATLQAIIHGVGYTVFYYEAGEWEYYLLSWKEAWWCLGAVAVIAMSFIVLSSFRIFRRKSYEFFLMVHILLSVVTIVALFYHTSIFEGEYDPYLWPLVAIWSFDRFLRIVRVVYCNIHVHFGVGKSIHHTEATVTHHQEGNFLEIKVFPGTQHLSPGPGQHYFLYEPLRLKGWENHPFTLASYDYSSPSPEESSALALSFWVRPQDGWTSRLKEKSKKNADAASKIRLLIEGPYGTAKPLWDYDEVMLIAGGSGIAAIMPYLQDYMKKTQESGPMRTTIVHFIWADRSEDDVRLLMNGPLGRVVQRDDIDTSLFITSGRLTTGSSLASAEKTEEPSTPDGVMSKEAYPQGWQSQQLLQLKSGRPDIRSIISTTAGEVSGRGRRLAVFACGPGTMVDAARDAARHSMRGAGNDVRFFEEAFGW